MPFGDDGDDKSNMAMWVVVGAVVIIVSALVWVWTLIKH